MDAMNRILGPSWDAHEVEDSHRTSFVATIVENREFVIRISCQVRDLISIERSMDFSPESAVSHYNTSHLIISFHIHSVILVRPTEE